jgi:DNA polymerase III alpha subunit (gram-positive type)
MLCSVIAIWKTLALFSSSTEKLSSSVSTPFSTNVYVNTLTSQSIGMSVVYNGNEVFTVVKDATYQECFKTMNVKVDTNVKLPAFYHSSLPYSPSEEVKEEIPSESEDKVSSTSRKLLAFSVTGHSSPWFTYGISDKNKAVLNKISKKKSVNKKSVNKKSVNKSLKKISKKSVNKKSVNKKSVNKSLKKSVNKKSVNKKSVNKKSVNKKSVNKKSVNKSLKKISKKISKKKFTVIDLDKMIKNIVNKAVNQTAKKYKSAEKRKIEKLKKKMLQEKKKALSKLKIALQKKKILDKINSKSKVKKFSSKKVKKFSGKKVQRKGKKVQRKDKKVSKAKVVTIETSDHSVKSLQMVLETLKSNQCICHH